MEKDYPVVGIDVARESSYYAIRRPDGTLYGNTFQAKNDGKGLSFVLNKLKKVEETLGKPRLVIESTGYFSARLVHFFTKNGFKLFLVNPLQSHSIKASNIRKAKTDKLDCKELSQLPFILDLREYKPKDENVANLQILCRTLNRVSKRRVQVINGLMADLEQAWPAFYRVFRNVGSKTSLALLTRYSSPSAFMDADKDEVIDLIKTNSRRSRNYAENKYELLRQGTEEAMSFGIQLSALFVSISVNVNCLNQLDNEISKINNEINQFAVTIPDVALLKTISGVGDNIAPTLCAEIGDIKRFKSAKQLVAYCGIDPSVKQSGNFTGTRNKLTKRGSPFVRQALYIAATVAVRKDINGNCVNPVLYEYYQKKLANKTKKQALGAVMNKLVRIIYSVLKNQKPFVIITPEEQKSLYRQKLGLAA